MKVVALGRRILQTMLHKNLIMLSNHRLKLTLEEKITGSAPSSFQSTDNIPLIETCDCIQNWEHLNLIFLVYFDLMRQFSCIYPEGPGELFLY